MSSPEIKVTGKPIDDESRCIHYHSTLDIISIKFKCCNQYYPCYYCHLEEADHLPQVWKKDEYEMKSILCGHCKSELTISQYLKSGNECPDCGAKFNPKCINHHHLYFEID